MGSVHICVGLLLSMILGVLSETKTYYPEEDIMKGGIVGYITGSRFFIITDKLPTPEKELKYTFIVVKHGMVVPEVSKAKTYPKDPIYKQHWEPGKVTRSGRLLMLTAGRSLKTRYQNFLKQIESWDNITVSSITKEYAKNLTAQLGFGLFSESKYEKELGIDLSWVLTDQDYEKMEKIVPVSDKCKWIQILFNMFEVDLVANPAKWTRCTENLYETLQHIIPVVDDDDREWKIDSPGRVYKLWSLLVFEILQGQKEPEWATEMWSRIQPCVFEFYKKLLTYHPAIPAVASGRMIHQMEKELNSGKHKFHVHVTNDIGALSMNWTLPNSKRDFWPDAGDALIFDFFMNDTVEVWSFSGFQRTFDKIYEAAQQDFFQEYKKRNIYISEEEWNTLCAHDGNATPPENMDSSLFSPPKPEERRDTTKDSEIPDAPGDIKSNNT